MSCLKVLRRMFGRQPSRRAIAAELMAEESYARATSDAEAVRAGLAHCDEITARLREHNISNHYAEWVRRALAQ